MILKSYVTTANHNDLNGVSYFMDGTDQRLHRPHTKSSRRDEHGHPFRIEIELKPCLALRFLYSKNRVDGEARDINFLLGNTEGREVDPGLFASHKIPVYVMEQPYSMSVPIGDNNADGNLKNLLFPQIDEDLCRQKMGTEDESWASLS